MELRSTMQRITTGTGSQRLSLLVISLVSRIIRTNRAQHGIFFVFLQLLHTLSLTTPPSQRTLAVLLYHVNFRHSPLQLLPLGLSVCLSS